MKNYAFSNTCKLNFFLFLMHWIVYDYMKECSTLIVSAGRVDTCLRSTLCWRRRLQLNSCLFKSTLFLSMTVPSSSLSFPCMWRHTSCLSRQLTAHFVDSWQTSHHSWALFRFPWYLCLLWSYGSTWVLMTDSWLNILWSEIMFWFNLSLFLKVLLQNGCQLEIWIHRFGPLKTLIFIQLKKLTFIKLYVTNI